MISQVFVLSTGRCGTMTLARACSHMSNYSSAHESRLRIIGDGRLDYPQNHIESDNRLVWFLGRLQERFGDSAYYVHLIRDPEAVAQSYNRRWARRGNMSLAYTRGILSSSAHGIEPCRDYVRTVNENVRSFLRDKSCKITIDIDQPRATFTQFWEDIGAEGDLELALTELESRHNRDALQDVEPSLAMLYEEIIQEQRAALHDMRLSEKEQREKINAMQDNVKSLRAEIFLKKNSLEAKATKLIRKSQGKSFAYLRVMAGLTGAYLSRRKSKDDHKKDHNRNAVFEVWQHREAEDYPKRLVALQNKGTEHQKRAVNLLIADHHRNDSEVWLKNINTYLLGVNGQKIELMPTGPSLFSRLSPGTNRLIEDGPVISVIMPAHNAEQTIRHAVYSILNQTWRQLQLIVVDDASTDSTPDILKELASRDDRMTVLRNGSNSGPYVSKNLALDHVRGEYLTGHDADDWALPHRLENQIEAIRRNARHQATICCMLRIAEDGRFTQFSQLGRTSFDGAARLASISAMFDVRFFKQYLGHWDEVKFGGDSELIARSQIILGDDFHTDHRISMFCLDHERSLTNDVVHGVSRESGISTVRKDYREAYRSWHDAHGKVRTTELYLPFPQESRKFPVPMEMRALTGNSEPIKIAS